MAYCKNCGASIQDGSPFCPHCGANQNAGVPQNYYQQNPYQQPVYDSGSFGYGVLGFCFPIVGLILWLVWKDNKPRSASIAGKGALIAVIVTIGLYLIGMIFGVALIGMA